MRNKIRAFLRLTFFAIGSLIAILRYLIKAAIMGNDLNRALRIRKQWFRIINWSLGITIESFGQLPKETGLLVCNHRSYYDPILVLSQLFALPVGKSEVASWPIIGIGAKISGAIFVERRSPEGRQKARKEILKTIQEGYFVINYPEGTTHTNSQTIDFKPGMFKDAAVEGFPIYPIVHEYQEEKDAWVGDDTFIRHFFECFGKKKHIFELVMDPKL